MYLLVQPTGARLFRFNYRRPGTCKRNTLALGMFPDVSLRKARYRRDEARAMLADGIDPSAQRKAVKAECSNTFEAIAREWHAKHKAKWTPSYGAEILRRLEANVFPHIGAQAIGSVNAPDILAVLRRIEARGAVDLAHRQHQVCGQVFRYAVATGR
ncbi:tyrosine-type recombinase/integrase, partial [Metallibacterium sp.]